MKDVLDKLEARAAPTRDLSEFNQGALDLSKAVLLHGQAGCGKTQFTRAHFDNPLVVSQLEDLKKLNHTHDGLVFDDFNLQGLKPENAIHLLDMELPRSFKVRYSNVEIPANMPRIYSQVICRQPRCSHAQKTTPRETECGADTLKNTSLESCFRYTYAYTV